jgi:carbamoyltransferase
MYILGLHNDEDSGVALLKDGQILDVVNEERLNRTKLFQGFPELALAHVLDKHGLALADIDHFVYGWHGRRNDYPDYARRLARRIVTGMQENPAVGGLLIERVDTEFLRDAETRDLFEARMAALGIPASRIVYLDHHQSHSWGTFACSPFDESLVFTFDGRGDLKSTTVSYADSNTGIRELDYLLSMDSIGFLYGQITHYLGYKPHRHEGKVTGLAAYGKPERSLPLFRRLLAFEDGAIHARLGMYRPFYTRLHPELVAELDKLSREDIAAGLQTHCEDLVTQHVAHWRAKVDRPGNRNICLSGGVAANVKINQRVAELKGVDRVFVFPHMGDGGLPLGSACYQHFLATGQAKVSLPHVYFGPSYGDDAVLDELQKRGSAVEWTRLEDRVASTVEDLAANRVVGWFDGRMEFGPRALGARSIMFHTRDASVNDWLNKRMRRTEFMPFAPVTPHEYAAECYAGWRADDLCTPFMTKTFDCTPAFKAVHKAVVHVDGTARPQTVTVERNGDYYRVVKAYCTRTGERALINTSFNAHEEPIVCSPRDAVNSLLDDVVDVLVLGNYRVVVGGKAAK